MGFLRQYCNEQWRRFALTNGSRSSEDRLPFVTASASVKMFSDDATVDSCLPLVIDRVATKPFSSLSCFTVTFTAWFWTTPWWSTLFRVKFWNQILLCAAVCKYIFLFFMLSLHFSRFVNYIIYWKEQLNYILHFVVLTLVNVVCLQKLVINTSVPGPPCQWMFRDSKKWKNVHWQIFLWVYLLMWLCLSLICCSVVANIILPSSKGWWWRGLG